MDISLKNCERWNGSCIILLIVASKGNCGFPKAVEESQGNGILAVTVLHYESNIMSVAHQHLEKMTQHYESLRDKISLRRIVIPREEREDM